MKICTDCKQEKNLDEFYVRNDVRYRKEARQSYCSDCCKVRKHAWYEKRKFDCDVRFKNLNSSAKQRNNLEVDLSLEEYSNLVKLPCHYCGQSLDKHVGIGLDRKDNNLGYTKDNSLPCCTECNVGKGEFYSYEEWKVMINALLRYREENGRGQQTRTAGPKRARSV